MGLVGYGAVPQLLAPVLRAMGASVLYWTREPKPEAPEAWRPLQSLIEAADILSLHVPLLPETERMIDGPALARMRQGAVLINTARGGLVDEPALIEALRTAGSRPPASTCSHPSPCLPAIRLRGSRTWC